MNLRRSQANQGKLKAAIKAARRRANAAEEIEASAIAAAVFEERLDALSDEEKTALEEEGRRVLADAEADGVTGLAIYDGAKEVTSENADTNDYMLLGFAAMAAGKRQRGHGPMAPPGTATIIRE